jgi:hypothetical protein
MVGTKVTACNLLFLGNMQNNDDDDDNNNNNNNLISIITMAIRRRGTSS